jgi:phosphonopyruvate decarboxylase
MMGSITTSLLEMLGIPVYTLNENETESFALIAAALSKSREISAPVALLVPEKIFEGYAGTEEKDLFMLNRETVIKELIAALQGDETVVCTTGKTGREFNEQNLAAEKKISRFFLNTGAMGHAGHIALGLTLSKDQKTILLDGDGAFMMHMGGLPAIARLAGNDLIHILINNGSHESVGGQPTHAFSIDCCGIAESCGYKKTVRITNETEWKDWLSGELFPGEKQFIEIRTSRISREGLARPAGEPADWKKELMASLEKK